MKESYGFSNSLIQPPEQSNEVYWMAFFAWWIRRNYVHKDKPWINKSIKHVGWWNIFTNHIWNCNKSTKILINWIEPSAQFIHFRRSGKIRFGASHKLLFWTKNNNKRNAFSVLPLILVINQMGRDSLGVVAYKR